MWWTLLTHEIECIGIRPCDCRSVTIDSLGTGRRGSFTSSEHTEPVRFPFVHRSTITELIKQNVASNSSITVWDR